jgi:hypothetical protein
MPTLTTGHLKFRQIATTRRLPLDVSVKLDLGKLTVRQRQNLCKAIRRGVYWGSGGQAWTYRLLGETFGFPTMCVTRHKRRVVRHDDATVFGGKVEEVTIPAYWCVYCENITTGKLDEIFKGELAAIRLAGANVYTRVAHNKVLVYILDEAMMNAAGAERVAKFPAEAATAVQAVVEGMVIDIKHHPVPALYKRRKKDV